MELDLTKLVIEAMAEAKASASIAQKALDIALEALIELKAMKQSTHKVEIFNPMGEEAKKILEEGIPTEEDAPPPPRVKLSPFAAFGGAREQMVREAEEALEQPAVPTDPITTKLDMEEALWEDALS